MLEARGQRPKLKFKKHEKVQKGTRLCKCNKIRKRARTRTYVNVAAVEHTRFHTQTHTHGHAREQKHHERSRTHMNTKTHSHPHVLTCTFEQVHTNTRTVYEVHVPRSETISTHKVYTTNTHNGHVHEHVSLSCRRTPVAEIGCK